MTIDADTGLVQWTPDDSQIGTQDVVIAVDDGLGGRSTQSFAVVVAATPRNQSPVITSSPSLVATQGLPYTYQITATDPEGQALEFLLVQPPANAFIDSNTGVVNWTPLPIQLGPMTLTVAARDPAGATAVQRFTVEVADSNSAPIITSAPVLTVTEG